MKTEVPSYNLMKPYENFLFDKKGKIKLKIADIIKYVDIKSPSMAQYE